MNYTDAKCDIFDDKGKLIDQVKTAVVLPPIPGRDQYFQIDMLKSIVQSRTYDPINMLRIRHFDKRIRFMSNIDPNTNDIFVELEGEPNKDM